jgi:hypothetical protein
MKGQKEKALYLSQRVPVGDGIFLVSPHKKNRAPVGWSGI